MIKYNLGKANRGTQSVKHSLCKGKGLSWNLLKSLQGRHGSQ